MGNVKGDKSVRLYKAKQTDKPYRTLRREGRMSDDGHNLLSMISFDGFVFMFVDGKYYTIDELCGEEE